MAPRSWISGENRHQEPFVGTGALVLPPVSPVIQSRLFVQGLRCGSPTPEIALYWSPSEDFVSRQVRASFRTHIPLLAMGSLFPILRPCFQTSERDRIHEDSAVRFSLSCPSASIVAASHPRLSPRNT